ncbi:MAG: dihydrofolate reductase [Hyphomicrobiales bacterium]|nr:dihydrofolate reductase [Hyphomicrobiales bacterium]
MTGRKLAILAFLTLDGVMQAPSEPQEDQSGDFQKGGWAMPFWDEVMEQVKVEAMAEPYDLLLGRRTYQIFAPNFATASDSLEAGRLNAATKYVATTTHSQLDWQPSIALTGDIAAEVARLKHRDGPLLQVHGSWQLIQTLLVHDLIDEFRLWTFPLVAGSGKRLFGGNARPTSLTLVKSGSTVNGVIMSIYRRAVGWVRVARVWTRGACICLIPINTIDAAVVRVLGDRMARRGAGRRLEGFAERRP